MSEMGIAFRVFSVNMESNTTTYVLFGVIAVVIWKLSSIYMAKSMDPKVKKEEKNGVIHESSVKGGDVAARGTIANGTLSAGRYGHADSTDGAVSGQWGEFLTPAGGAVPDSGGGGSPAVSWKTAGEACIGEEVKVVSLLDSGWTEEELDGVRCPFEAYGWFACCRSCGCVCELNVNLQNEQGKSIFEQKFTHKCFQPTKGIYKKVSVIFENYGSGVRHVTFCHRIRRDEDGGCNGCRGSNEMYCGLRKILKNKVT